jgi:MFS family permease
VNVENFPFQNPSFKIPNHEIPNYKIPNHEIPNPKKIPMGEIPKNKGPEEAAAPAAGGTGIPACPDCAAAAGRSKVAAADGGTDRTADGADRNACPALAAPVAATPAAPAAAKKTWRAGTLVYTGAGLAALFFWLLLGDFSWSLRDRSVAPMAQWYLNHLGVSSLLFGLLISSLPAALGLVLGPVISVKSDRHRGPRGRRVPFLLVTTPVAALGMVGLGLTPLIARGIHAVLPGAGETLAAVVSFGVFWTMWEVGTIASKAVFNGLVNDVVPKPLLGRFYGLFRAIGLLDGMVFNFWIMGLVPAHFTLILCVVGVFYGMTFMVVCLKVREGGYPPPPPPESAGGGGGAVAGWARRGAAETRRYCRECFSRSYYVAVFALLMLAGVQSVPVNVFTIPQAKALGVSMDVYGKFVALSFLISLCLSFFIGWLADRFHPLRMAMVTLAGYAAVAVWGGFCATTPAAFLAAWVLHSVLGGAYLTGAASLGQRLFPHARFAQFASAGEAFVAVANMVLAPAVGLLIDATGKDYRLTFFAGAALSCGALGCAAYVHTRFKRLGGPANYVAPE